MGEADAIELFRNEDWSLSRDGLEHRGTGYFIDRAVLAARRAEQIWDWPVQMAEKRWCRPSLFREAFLAALDTFGIPRDAALTRSFALGFGMRAADAPGGPGFISLGDVLAPREKEVAVAAPVSRPIRALASASA